MVGTEGPWSAGTRRRSGGPPEARRLPRLLPRPACVAEAGGSAWMVVWLLPCISGV